MSNLAGAPGQDKDMKSVKCLWRKKTYFPAMCVHVISPASPPIGHFGYYMCGIGEKYMVSTLIALFYRLALKNYQQF